MATEPPPQSTAAMLDSVITVLLDQAAPLGLTARLFRVLPHAGVAEVQAVLKVQQDVVALCPVRKLEPATQYTVSVSAPQELPFEFWFSTRALCCVGFRVRDESRGLWASSRLPERLELVFRPNVDPYADLRRLVAAHFGRRQDELLTLVAQAPDGVSWPVASTADVAQLDGDDVLHVAFRPVVATPFGRGTLVQEREDGVMVVRLGWSLAGGQPAVAYLQPSQLRPTTLPAVQVDGSYYIGRHVALDYGLHGVFGGIITAPDPAGGQRWAATLDDGSDVWLSRREVETALDLRATFEVPRANGADGRRAKRAREAGDDADAGARATNSRRRQHIKHDPDGDLRVDEFVVDRILSHRRLRPGLDEFLVHWAAQPVLQSTWEPLQNLAGCPQALEEFKERHGPW